MDQEQNRRQLVESIEKQNQSLIHTDQEKIREDKAKQIGRKLWKHVNQAHKAGYIDSETKKSLEKQINELDTHGLTSIGVGVCNQLKEAIKE